MEPYKITINGVEYVDIQVVAEYYDVKVETIRDWIKKRKISGKEISNQAGNYIIPLEEFEYLKRMRDKDQTENVIRELLGEDYEDWYVDED
ncbi:hypothetical protein MHI02_05755 [Oceanobacillus sp. FSL K6-0118]|uniref:hypothetical protein n=1 Tax=Oceanobacillus sp. FSL K6-0118 TaxID=2921418 RepID=UPI0030FABDB5